MKAFPRGTSAVHEGMDLRDYFAAAALQGLLAEDADSYTFKDAAFAAYAMADAMMEARNERA